MDSNDLYIAILTLGKLLVKDMMSFQPKSHSPHPSHPRQNNKIAGTGLDELRQLQRFDPVKRQVANTAMPVFCDVRTLKHCRSWDCIYCFEALVHSMIVSGSRKRWHMIPIRTLMPNSRSCVDKRRGRKSVLVFSKIVLVTSQPRRQG